MPSQNDLSAGQGNAQGQKSSATGSALGVPILHAAFDFTRYQPGDTICISHSDLQLMPPDYAQRLPRIIQDAARRAGLGWSIEQDLRNLEYRVRFHEPEDDALTDCQESPI